MKESDTIKEYSNTLLGIANKVRLLGTAFSDSRIVEKILVSVPERYEAFIATLENTKDLSKITLVEVLHALQAQEQRRLMRQEGSVEGAFQVKFQSNDNKHKKKQKNDTRPGRLNKINNKSNNTQLGHMEKICKSHQQQGEVKVSEDQPQEEQFFVVTCFVTNSSIESWLIDSGYTNHMSYDRELFTELDKIVLSKVRVGNGAYIVVKGKETMAIEG
ncbi:uncharacterized protein LOC106763651 [Vigna radiata var. radiata]|uniref:Uncharacterized protein LOC106763651 n=1 Tax=Vigna radiata var. radiata TaxID=3916 RepID=A0A1S3UBA8_VIGRR|nr:uncharacterized protein LOC106763651 [Vigna radiata var. radiata]